MGTRQHPANCPGSQASYRRGLVGLVSHWVSGDGRPQVQKRRQLGGWMNIDHLVARPNRSFYSSTYSKKNYIPGLHPGSPPRRHCETLDAPKHLLGWSLSFVPSSRTWLETLETKLQTWRSQCRRSSQVPKQRWRRSPRLDRPFFSETETKRVSGSPGFNTRLFGYDLPNSRRLFGSCSGKTPGLFG